MRKTLATTGLIALGVFTGSHVIAETQEGFQGEAQDAWLTGRIETMYLLNEHLNAFEITPNVDNGTVVLTGTVDSEIDKDLAGKLARNLDGVERVENELVVDVAAEAARESNERRDFGTWVDDATTTAAVKTRLIGNSNTKGLQIDVDTDHDVVTLSGSVSTDEEKALAEEIARLAKDVEEVRNNLVVDPS